MRRGIISSCQSAATSEIVKSTHVSSAIASILRPLPLPFYMSCLYAPTEIHGVSKSIRLCLILRKISGNLPLILNFRKIYNPSSSSSIAAAFTQR